MPLTKIAAYSIIIFSIIVMFVIMHPGWTEAIK